MVHGGSIGDALKNGAISAGVGALAGGAIGAVSGAVGAGLNNAKYNKQVAAGLEPTGVKVNIWSGKPVTPGRSSWSFVNHKPVHVKATAGTTGPKPGYEIGGFQSKVDSKDILEFSRKTEFPKKELRKFVSKHGEDFGIESNYKISNGVDYENTIKEFIKSPNTDAIRGTYRGEEVIHFVDVQSSQNLVFRPNGAFWTGWKLGNDQLFWVFSFGKLN
ncbi:MAG: colicin D domain-containing protein [Flavobacteriales bacterium]